MQHAVPEIVAYMQHSPLRTCNFYFLACFQLKNVNRTVHQSIQFFDFCTLTYLNFASHTRYQRFIAK